MRQPWQHWLQRGLAAENSAMKTTANAAVSLVIVCQAGKYSLHTRSFYYIVLICDIHMYTQNNTPKNKNNGTKIEYAKFNQTTANYHRFWQLWQKSIRHQSTGFPAESDFNRNAGETRRLHQIKRSYWATWGLYNVDFFFILWIFYFCLMNIWHFFQ